MSNEGLFLTRKYLESSAEELLLTLIELVDLQNGPPLLKEKDAWDAAMLKAGRIIAKATGRLVSQREGEAK